MDTEAIEKRLKEVQDKLSNEAKKGQRKIQEINKLTKDLQIGAGLLERWRGQLEGLKEALEK